MLASATVHSFDPPTPGLHPVASRMLDIILAKAVDGEPTMAEDLDGFTQAEIAQHFRAAHKAALKVTVRQVDDERGFETHTQLLDRCVTALMASSMPAETDMVLTLRRQGLALPEIAQLWPELVEITAEAWKKSRSTLLCQVQ